ncbi:hypothetical protein EG68_07929 [Paragonimus skrjabini miyazakii]|uniref:Snake toxin/toxin-like domain-containing protein n=1 Tax=Paragonimus skrjabini miyazakii TaxID=59628 RepID=A0A8S9YRF4_9TREM|nr:hypothetical protein EG68_07929 [Paragonimus skrjabini miyazakii]
MHAPIVLISAIFVITIAKLYYADADTIKCYQCNNCPVPFDERYARKLANCNYCRTVFNYQAPERFTVEKECVVSCLEKDRLQDGVGIVTNCCSSDYCNPATNVQTNGRLLAASSLVLLPVLWKALV